MPQSLSHVILHISFSTKGRRRWIDEEIESRLHAYMATLAEEEGCHSYRIGGVEDHVHIVTTLSRTTTISRLIEVVKSRSSGWIKKQGNKYQEPCWQTGSASFSVSPKDKDAVIDYVSNQHEHHKQESFQDEMRRFFEKYDIEYDEKYVWD